MALELGYEIGYLAPQGALYCSEACAQRAGERAVRPVDPEEYDLLSESGQVPPEALCPSCGQEFAVDSADREA